MTVDLHVHTVASDGTATLTERVTQAVERDVEALAVTDHDVLGAELETRTASHDGVEVVTGVEVRADVDGTKVEVLGYFLRPTDDDLQDLLRRVRDFRVERNRRLVENLQARTDFDRTFEDVSADVDGLVGRPHLADRLVADGVVESVGEAFDRHLGSDGDCFVPMRRLPATEVIGTLRGAGGVTSLAHPGRIRADRETVGGFVTRLAEAGLDAVEVWYPYGDHPSPAYADIDVDAAARIAEANGLLATGGSDCHGPGSGKFRLGEVGVTGERLEALREVASERGSGPVVAG